MKIEMRKTLAISTIALTLGAIGGTVFSHGALAQTPATPTVPQTPGSTSPDNNRPDTNSSTTSPNPTNDANRVGDDAANRMNNDANRVGNRRPLDRPSNLPGQSPRSTDTSRGMEAPVSGSASTPFGNFDTNADGKISRDEMKADAKMSRKFESMDRNRDGFLAEDEYSVKGSASAKRTSRDSTSRN